MSKHSLKTDYLENVFEISGCSSYLARTYHGQSFKLKQV